MFCRTLILQDINRFPLNMFLRKMSLGNSGFLNRVFFFYVSTFQNLYMLCEIHVSEIYLSSVVECLASINRVS